MMATIYRDLFFFSFFLDLYEYDMRDLEKIHIEGKGQDKVLYLWSIKRDF